MKRSNHTARQPRIRRSQQGPANRPTIRHTVAHRVCCCLGLLALLTSCTPAPMTNTVVTRADSPDGHLSALLVDRYYHAALVSDGFFLILVPRGRSIDSTISAKNIGDAAALVATWASKVRLSWRGNDTLTVLCDSCGLRAIDISKRLDLISGTRILYLRFPEHTAYH